MKLSPPERVFVGLRVPVWPGTTWRLLLKELGTFGIVGNVCFLIDLGVFRVLYAQAGPLR
jgi:hypothetical protein